MTPISQCSLSRDTRRVCSRGVRAGWSCLLPVLCPPQGRTGAEGFPAFSGGLSSPWYRARSLARKFRKTEPKIFTKFGPAFARKIWACFYSMKDSQPFWSPLGKDFKPPFGHLIWGAFVHYSALVCLLFLTFLFGEQVMHYADLQGLNTLITSKVCTMLLGWVGSLHAVAVIRQPRHQQNSTVNFIWISSRWIPSAPALPKNITYWLQASLGNTSKSNS